MKNIKTPDDYFQTVSLWRDEVKALRSILLRTALAEEIKWGAPCYSFNGKNVVGLGAFKHYFGLWFHQGVLLADKEKVLVNAQKGTTKALRQWRMTAMEDIKQDVIIAYVSEAISLVKAGKSIAPDRNKPLVLPAELFRALETNMAAKTAFEKLRPGLQREYADYIAQAKQVATRQRRLEKILPMISAGSGLNDKYRLGVRQRSKKQAR